LKTLPIYNRNFTSLQLLSPRGAASETGVTPASENPQGSQQIENEWAALLPVQAFELDGTDNQDPILGIIVVNPKSSTPSTKQRLFTRTTTLEFGQGPSERS